jgi:glycosyltransferase involved in cell wall biosynthesis
MKVFNLIWGFSLGTGIDKCFLIYDRLSEFDKSVEVHSVCINITNIKADLSELQQRGVTFIDIKGKKDFSWVGRLARLIKQSKPDVIFTHGFNGAIMMLIERILMRIKIPIICSEHGLYFPSSPQKKFIALVYNYLMKFTYKYVADRLICVDNSSRQYWIKKGVNPSKIVTVHNGINSNVTSDKINRADWNINEDEQLLVTVSSLYNVKGLIYLLEAIAIVKAKTEVPFRYIMIGKGEDYEKYVAKVKELSIEDRVVFAGYQNNIVDWLNTADIYLLPSLSECHSISLLEAMRAGKTIIATNVGGNPESIRDGIDGILVPSKDPDALAESILHLFKFKESSQKLARSAQERFNFQFTEQVMKQNLITALKL